MIDVRTIKAAIDQVGSSSREEFDETMREYLESMLQDEDAYDDLEALTDAVQPFLNDDRQAAENLVISLAQETGERVINAAAGPPNNASCSHARNLKDCSSDEGNDSSSSPVSVPLSTTIEPLSVPAQKQTAKSHAAQRKERRRKKRQAKKKQAENEPSTANSDSSGSEHEKINDVVARLNKRSEQELNEMDDYSSAWEQQVANSKDSPVIWGGRGCGGRGVNRGKGIYKGKDAVVNQLTLSYGGGRDLLYETHLVIAHGHRYGLMGPNGVGKSTLLKRIASGTVPGWPLHLTVHMVEQEVLGSSRSALECMREVVSGGGSARKGKELEEEVALLETVLDDPNTNAEDMESAAERLSEIYDELEALDNNDDIQGNDEEKDNVFSGLDKRAKTILKGLQFKESMLNLPGTLLSGGWRIRVALAQALYLEPDILLLDEPTNHLDLSAIMFLENYLVEKAMTVVVVSHDGHFLDAICTDIIKFEPTGKLKYHVGNYTSFRNMEEQSWARNSSKADAVARKEKKAQEFIQKQRSMSNSKHRDDNKQRQAAERQKKLSRIGLFSENGQKFKLLAEGNRKSGGSNRAGHIFGNYKTSSGMESFFVSNEQVAFGENKQQLNFKFPAAPPLKGGGSGRQMPLITMEDCFFRYDKEEKFSSWLLQDVSLRVDYGSRIAVVGKNGAGKSTLLNILSSKLEVNRGEFHSHPNLRVAHIAQHHIEHLGAFLELSPVEYFLQQHQAKNKEEARQFLGGFGLVGPLALQGIGTLSGGQKARLAFATVLYAEPHVLILDEPTNHLDRDSLDSLAKAVEKFQGAVVIVSHNQDFMSRCATEMWTVADTSVKVEVADGEVDTFNDVFERYKEGLKQEFRKK